MLKQFLSCSTNSLESHTPFHTYRKCTAQKPPCFAWVNDLLQAQWSCVYFCHICLQHIDHDILISRLHTTLWLLAVLDCSYLSFRTQSVLVGHTSTALKYGVPQGSVLGPLLFTLYTQSLSTIICKSGHIPFHKTPQFELRGIRQNPPLPLH